MSFSTIHLLLCRKHMKTTITFRIIKLIMAFAIFWMVIGELITLHQRRMFGNDLFGNHLPFTKPKTSDDGHTAHFKAFKIFDKTDNSKSNLFFYSNQQLPSLIAAFNLSVFEKPHLNFKHRYLHRCISFRAPPSYLI